MPDLKISQLPVASTPLAGTELVPIVQGGTTDQTTVQAILTGTVPSGTANGVLYLNGSKVVTSGSALTFDGTYFTVGASSTTGDYKAFIQKAGGELLGLNASSGTLARIAFGNATASFGNTQIIANAADLTFVTNNNEQMRLTSTGLGIGTSSPGTKLEVANTSGSVAATLRSSNSGYSELYFADVADNAAGAISYEHSSNTIRLYNAGSARVYLDSSGNLGLGTSSFGTSAAGVLSIGNGTEPSTGPANTVQVYSVDLSAGNTIPAIYCEGSGVTNAGITNVTVTNKIAIKVNGTVYYLLATTNAT